MFVQSIARATRPLASRRLRGVPVIGAFLLLGSIAAAGCAGGPAGGHPAASQAPWAVARYTFPYTLMPGDTVGVSVWNHPEFSGESAVAPDGGIEIRNLTSRPDTLRAQDLTTGRLTTEIAELLGRYVEDPIVKVRMVHYGSRRIYVFGHVANPGVQVLDEFGLTLRDAIVRAGLPTDDAATGRVAVIQGAPGLVAKRLIDLGEILEEGRLDHNVALLPNAVVYVPMSRSAWLMKRVFEPIIKLGAGVFVFFRLGEELGAV